MKRILLVLSLMSIIAGSAIMLTASSAMGGEEREAQVAPKGSRLYRVCSVVVENDGAGYFSGYNVMLKFINVNGEEIYKSKISPRCKTLEEAMLFLNSKACAN